MPSWFKKKDPRVQVECRVPAPLPETEVKEKIKPSDIFKEYNLRVVTDAAPVQIEGNYDGTNIYFRERSGKWQFAVYYGGYQGDESEVAVGSCEEFMDVADALLLTLMLCKTYFPKPRASTRSYNRYEEKYLTKIEY